MVRAGRIRAAACAALLLAGLAAAPAPARCEVNRGRAALMSLLVPGWGQYKLGSTRMAAVFGTMEAAGWIGYITFHHEESLRHDSEVLMARVHARIDVEGRGADFERDVGSYINSEEYNREVVLFNAEAIYGGVTDPAQRIQLVHDYVSRHSYGGGSAWQWDTNDSRVQYLVLQKSSLSAHRNGNYALGLVVANHLLAAADALRPRRSAGEKLGLWDAVPSVGLRGDGSPALVWSIGF